MGENFSIRSFLANIGLAVVLNGLVKLAWIFVNNVVQDRIGHSDFGTYSALYALGFLFITFSDLGLNQYATRKIAGDRSLLQQLFPTLISIKLVLILVYPVFMTAVGAVLGYPAGELWLLFLLCLTQALAQLIWLYRAGFQAFQLFRVDAVAGVVDRFLLLLIILFLLWKNEISLSLYVWSGLASVGLASLFLYGFVVRIFGWIKPVFQRDEMVRLLKDSFPFALITLLYSLNDKIDQVMLERIAGDHETGLYAGAYRWVDAVMMYLWTILPVFFARFALYSDSRAEKEKLLSTGQWLTALPMIALSAFAWFHGDTFLFLFRHSTPAELEVIRQCLKVLFLSVMVNGVFAIFSTMLTATGHEKFVGWMIAFSILISVSLNALFIPGYGAVASAWVTLVTYSFLSLSYVVYLFARVKVKLPWLNVAGIALYALIVWMGFYLTSTWFSFGG